ncbi:hypothetical protein Tco_1109505 [Tanacetum coccineum]
MMPLCDNPTPLKAFKYHSEIVVNSNDDDTSSDDDDFEGIKYVEASPPDLKIGCIERYKGLKTKQKRYEVRGTVHVRCGSTRWRAEVSVRGTRYCSKWWLANQSVKRGIWRVSVRGRRVSVRGQSTQIRANHGNNEAVGEWHKNQNTP